MSADRQHLSGWLYVVRTSSGVVGGGNPLAPPTALLDVALGKKGRHSRRCHALQVYAAKGKQRMRTNNGQRAQQMMQQQTPPTPPVDPENEEFVIFVKSAKVWWLTLARVRNTVASQCAFRR